MKQKVLIIANLWPPNSSTGMYRTKGFVENLHLSGYYPILITQNWNDSEAEELFVKEEHENYEVYRMSCGKYSSRRIMNFLNKRNWTILRRAYNFFDRFLWTIGFWLFQDYRYMLKMSLQIADRENIKKAIIISDPFQLYFIGYKLSKKLGVKWIADYRDAWNTMEFSDTFTFKENRLNNFLKRLERTAEKKWVGTADYITAVSGHYAKRIAEFVKVPYQVIYNGFFLSELDAFKATPRKRGGIIPDKLIIVYNGTLYPAQKVEIFIEGYKEFIDQNPEVLIELRFIGLNAINYAAEKVSYLLKGYEKYYKATDRIPKNELIAEISQADALLLVTQGPEHKGVATSKIFDYLASSKPVICSPSDNDVVEEILRASGQGLFADTPAEVSRLLTLMTNQLQEHGVINLPFNPTGIMEYSREHQTTQMAALLDKI